MNAVRILHCSDLHLGAEAANLGLYGRQRKEEMLHTFRNICLLCNEASIDLLLIAGDLFESNNVHLQTVRSVQEYLGWLEHTRVFISPGNHDYLSPDSPYMDTNWPANTHIFGPFWEGVELPELSCSVYGFGFDGSYVKESRIEKVTRREDDHIYIGLVHGELVSRLQISHYHPIRIEEISNSGLDYLALGHIHVRSEMEHRNRTFFAYSGTPEAHGFDETGSKGVYLGEVRSGYATLMFREMCRRQFLISTVDVTDCSGVSDMEARILDTLEKEHPETFANHFYRIELIGSIKENEALRLDTLATNLSDRLYYVKLIDKTARTIDSEVLRQEYSMKSLFVRKMIAAQDAEEPEEKEVLALALKYGLDAMEGGIPHIDY